MALPMRKLRSMGSVNDITACHSVAKPQVHLLRHLWRGRVAGEQRPWQLESKLAPGRKILCLPSAEA